MIAKMHTILFLFVFSILSVQLSDNFLLSFSIFLKILNEIKFVSFALPTFNVTSQGNIAIELSSVISLWGSHIAFEGSYSGEEKTFSFSAKSVEDTKPILLASVIPAFSSIPVCFVLSLPSHTPELK